MTHLKKIIEWLTAIVVTFTIAFAGFIPADAVRTSATTTEYPFDDVSVIDDLEGIGFSLSDYEDAAEPTLITIMEFAFGESVLDCGYYSIYAYVYNPEKVTFATHDGANVINMAVEYNSDGKPSGHDNLKLILCNKTSDNLLYKFRVQDEEGRLLSNARKQDNANGQRRYDVAGIQLFKAGDSYAVDYPAKWTYYYEGYAEGMGRDGAKASTLTVQNEQTISLEVFPTFYRPEGVNSEENPNIQDTLASVYFNVPNEYIEKYGELYAVHATFLKAVLSPAIVTNNNLFYEKVLSLILQTQADNEALKEYAAVGTGDNYHYIDADLFGSEFYSDTIFNPNSKINTILNNPEEGLGRLEAINIIFNSIDVNPLKYTVKSEEIIKYLLQHSTNKDVLGKYDSRLFKSVENQKTVVELTSEKKDDFNLTSITFNDFWNKFWGIETVTPYTMSAIQRIDKVDTAEQMESEYYINKSDFEHVKAQFNEPDKTLYVFHFAKDDYFQQKGMLLKGINHPADLGDISFLQQTVYLDFDIIDVTMRAGDKLTVLGVVASPIDVIPDLTPPPDIVGDDLPWWVVVIAVVLVLGILLMVTTLIKKGVKK